MLCLILAIPRNLTFYARTRYYFLSFGYRVIQYQFRDSLSLATELHSKKCLGHTSNLKVSRLSSGRKKKRLSCLPESFFVLPKHSEKRCLYLVNPTADLTLSKESCHDLPTRSNIFCICSKSLQEVCA